MPAVTGVDFIIQVNTGTEAAPVWTTVAGQRNATLNREVEEADATSKDSNGWYEGIPTIRSWSIKFDGLIVEDDTGYQALEDAYMNNEILQVQIVTPAGNKYTGKAYLTDFSLEAPYKDDAVYSGTLQGTGPLTKTTTP